MTPPQPTLAVEPVIAVLCGYLARKSRARLSPEQLDPDANVWTSGYVDSLAYVEFLVFIDEQYGVTVSDVDLTGDLNTIRAVARFICARHPREAAPVIRWNDLQFTIGMPHMVPGKLSEVELLKLLGSFQWDSISALLGLPSSQIVNALNERLYASFINIDLRFPAGQGQDSFDEGSAVHVRNGISVYANKFIEGLTVFSTTPIPAAATEGLSRCADLDRLQYPSAYLTNAFVTRMAGNTRLKVFEPSTMKARDVPRTTTIPPGIAEHEVVQFSGQVPDFGPAGNWAPLRVASEEPVRYAIVPESDLNGAGLLYFARYVAMMNYAERVFLTSRLVQPWSSQLAATLSTERRRIYYYANADPNDVVRAVVTGQVLTADPSHEAAPGSRRGTHIKLLFRLTLSRVSDNNLMAMALVRKTLSIPGHEKALIAESERFLAHQGLRSA